MDDVVRNALIKKRELLKELSKIDAFIEYYEELSGNKVRQDELLTPQKVGVVRIDLQDLVEKKSKKRNNIKKILDVAERLIREARRPLTRGEIAEGMERLNVVIHSDDVPKYLGTLLWRNGNRFISVEGEGYTVPAIVDVNPQMEYAPEIGDAPVYGDPLASLARIVAGEKPRLPKK